MIKILQFGEGNFLRAFAEYYIQLANENEANAYEVFICQPRSNRRVIDALRVQDCRYSIYLRGRRDGAVVDKIMPIRCVGGCIDTLGEYNTLRELFRDDTLKLVISNTTEAGIVFSEQDRYADAPYVSFSAKVTALLYDRYRSGGEALVFLPTELIQNNGDALKECVLQYAVLWKLGDGFLDYIRQCSFCNTLVDRIVTGHRDGDEDACSVICEPYGSWLIQADERAKKFIPAHKDIVFTDDLTPYQIRKVRILNGTHTMSVLAAYMAGFDIVREMMHDEVFSRYISLGMEEIKATIDLPQSELNRFAESVTERFDNPFIDHRLFDITLNSVSKFKARCLGTITDYTERYHTVPKILTFSLAALIAFYMKMGSAMAYEPNDAKEILAFFHGLDGRSEEETVRAVLSNTKLWDRDLSFLFENVLPYYSAIAGKGIAQAVKEVVYE